MRSELRKIGEKAHKPSRRVPVFQNGSFDVKPVGFSIRWHFLSVRKLPIKRFVCSTARILASWIKFSNLMQRSIFVVEFFLGRIDNISFSFLFSFQNLFLLIWNMLIQDAVWITQNFNLILWLLIYIYIYINNHNMKLYIYIYIYSGFFCVIIS